MTAPITYASIADLTGPIREQTLSSAEIVSACLARIETLNPRLNAFITVLKEDAQRHARIADAEIRAGGWRGPLHGIPVALKDFYDTAGTRTTGSCEQFRDRVPTNDAAVVTRLKEAGAVIVGKTNMDTLGKATTGQHSLFGPVRNPWNDAYISGGSSSGSAVAVATGMCFATVDTDAMGSVRLPAACNGVIGFKPTYGAISIDGILDGVLPIGPFITWMAHPSITTRSIDDTALLFEVLAGETVDLVIAPARVGVGTNLRVADEVQRIFNTASDTLRLSGWSTIDRTIPFGDVPQGFDRIEADRAAVGRTLFTDVDVLVLPTLATPVPRVEAIRDNNGGLSTALTAFANYLGLPAISVPCGLDAAGLPVGLHIVGKPGDERTVLSVAKHFLETAKTFAHPPL